MDRTIGLMNYTANCFHFLFVIKLGQIMLSFILEHRWFLLEFSDCIIISTTVMNNDCH